MAKFGKKCVFLLFCFLVLWLAAGMTDFLLVSNFDRPLFCLRDKDAYQDGGSGIYRGLGWSFDIKGHFLPDDEYPGVTEYTFYLFGNEVTSVIRD